MADAYTVSGTNQYSQLLTKIVASKLLSLLRGQLTYAPPGALQLSVYKGGSSDDYVYGGIPDLTAAIPPAMDELVPPAVELVTSFVSSFSTTEYARSIGFSSKLLRQQPFNASGEIAERVARSAAELINLVLQAEWARAKSGEASLGVGTATIVSDLLISAKAYLEAHDIPPMADGTYYVLCSPYFVADLKREVGDRAWGAFANFSNGDALQAGVLGKWQGFTFWGSSYSVPAAGTVETAIVCGANSIAIADLGSLATYLVLPQATISDPVAQRGVASYRLRLGAQAIARIQRQGGTTPVYSHVKVLSKLNVPTVAIAP